VADPGKQAVVQVSTSTDGSSGTNIGGMDSITMNDGTNLIDVTEFGVDNIQRIEGLKDVSFTISGSYTTGAGQNKIKTAKENGSMVYIKFYPLSTGSAGFKARCLCSTINIDTSPPDRVAVSYEFQNASSSGISSA